MSRSIHSKRPGCLFSHFVRAVSLAFFVVTTVQLAPAQTTAASTGAVRGRVENAVTASSLNNARISVVGTNIVTFTDEGGVYSLSGVPAGQQTLRVFFTGLDEKLVTVNVPAGQTVEQDVGLTSVARYGATAETVELDEFVVASTRETNASAIAVNEQRFAGNITSVVSTDEFGTVVDRNPGEFLKMLPGVDVEYFANNIVGVSVRGLGSVNTEVNFDGMPVASMNTEGVGRGFEMKGGSAADIARVEVRKLPLPEDSANALGGSINLIRRSAFEFTKRRIEYSFLLSSDAEEITLDKRDGPKDRQMVRWRPNWELKWTEPVNKNLGFAVTVGQNENIVMTHWSIAGYNFGNRTDNNAAEAAIAAGQPIPNVPSIYNPAMRNPLLHDAPLMQSRDYASARIDWRPRPELTLGYSLAGTVFHNQTADDIRFRWDAAATGSGDVAQFNNEFTTIGRLNGGAVRHDNPLWRDIYAPTVTHTFEGRWRKDAWTVSARGVWSQSKYEYADTSHGFFQSSSANGIPHVGLGAGTANPIPITLTFTDQTFWGPQTIIAEDASGNEVEWWKLENQRIGGARSRPGKSKEIVTAAKLFVKRDFSSDNPLSVQLGLDLSERYRNRRYDYDIWRFVGADGIPDSPDDSASLIAAEFLPPHRDTQYNFPPLERISMSKLYALYEMHPTWFDYEEAESYRRTRTSNAAYELTETTYAPYLQFDWRLMDNRLRLVGGVRYEKTEAEAVGLLDDASRAHQKNPDGTVVRDADGDPVLLPGITPNSLEYWQATLVAKGARGEGETDNYFPSLHATYNITENLIFQLGYAKTQARNRFDRTVIPSNSIDSEPRGSGALGRISLRNKDLEPWIGQNYETRLSYYNRTGGLIGLGLFRKNIANYQVSVTTDPLTAPEIAEWGFGPEYAGYEINTMFNRGGARIDGAELEFRQSLDQFLPDWGRGFLLRGAASYTNMKGQAPSGDFGGIKTWRNTLGLSYNHRKFSASVNYTYSGEQESNYRTSNGYEGQRFYLPQHMVDVTLDFAITRWAKIFLAARNLNDERRVRVERYDEVPFWGQQSISNTFGSTISVGVSGSF